MNQNVTNVKNQISQLERKIAEEKARLQTATQGKRDEISRRLAQAEADYNEAEGHLKTLQTQRSEALAELQQVEQEGKRMDGERNILRERITQNQQQIQHCVEREKNQLAPFGNSMDRVLADIAQTNWYGNKPVGPFGLYVNVKDSEKWAPLMRLQLGGMMGGFAITDARDRAPLKAILERYRK